jgi:hypothetical protein
MTSFFNPLNTFLIPQAPKHTKAPFILSYFLFHSIGVDKNVISLTSICIIITTFITKVSLKICII